MKKQKSKKKATSTPVRVNRELYEKLVKRSAKERRSISTIIDMQFETNEK